MLSPEWHVAHVQNPQGLHCSRYGYLGHADPVPKTALDLVALPAHYHAVRTLPLTRNPHHLSFTPEHELGERAPLVIDETDAV